jgi:hypothetical protein
MWLLLVTGGCSSRRHAVGAQAAAGTTATADTPQPAEPDAGAAPASTPAAGKAAAGNSGASGAAGSGGQPEGGAAGHAGQAGVAGSAGQPAAVSGNYVHLDSDPGDYIGDGRSYHYTERDAVLSFDAMNNGLVVSVNGDESWRGEFYGPASLSELSVGSYVDLERSPTDPTAPGALDWSGAGRGCNMLKGAFEISKLQLRAGTVIELDLSFEQHCEGAAAALRGQIHYRESERVAPNKPVQPAPAGLWEPTAGATPTDGRYVYLISEPGDPIGTGRTLVYTQANAQLGLTTSGKVLMIRVVGDSDWMGTFEGMLSISRLEPGYYAELERSVTQNPAKAGFSWEGEGHGCEPTNSWFVIDQIAYSADDVISIDLRFRQQCVGSDAALHGKLHWTPEDSTVPAGPSSTVPTDLWRPAAGQTPASPRYVYLQSSAGDDVGLGRTYAYTQANAVLTLEATGGYVLINVDAGDTWRGEFAAATGATRLQPAYYANLGRYPVNNPTEGGLAWSGNSTTCNALQGWFAVDSVSYSGDALSTLDVRFEQRCEGATGSLNGQVHWAAMDATVPPGPVSPPPNGLWKPAAGELPASGNYVHLHSEPGDTIGEGQTLDYPLDASALNTGNRSSGAAYLTVTAGEWQGSFVTMLSQLRLAPGYYGDLVGVLSLNPAKGGLEWSGGAHVCGALTGWFAVDKITYSGDAIGALDLRFEQHCGGATPALHGVLHLAP